MADIKQTTTDTAPAAIGPYSQALSGNGFLFISGQFPMDPATGACPAGGIAEQTEQSIRNIEAILKANGADASQVLKTTCLLADIADFSAMNTVYAKHFGINGPAPARAAFAVKDLPKGALIEIEAVALVK
jgi:2-iminobutanoate/2-iminopropanoate deaminase